MPNSQYWNQTKKSFKGDNIIDVDYEENNIYQAIKQCLFDKPFRKKAYKTHNPYGIGNTGTKIASFLANLKLDKKLLQKKMTIKGIKKNNWYK